MLLINKPDNRNYVWIIISIAGFAITIFAFIFYIFCLYEYFQIRTVYFDFSSSLWLFLNSLNVSAFTINRLLNTGVVLFVFSFLNFSYSYTHSIYDNWKKTVDYKFFILPLLFLIIYDPAVLNYFFRLALHIKRNYFNFSFTGILNILNWVNRIWIFAYLFIGFYWLYKDYKCHLIQRLKKKILYIVLCLIPISVLFALMFYWFPQQILILRESYIYNTAKSDYSYYDFSYGTFIHLPLLYKIYPIIALISTGILAYATYSLKAFTLFEKTQYNKIEYSLSTAELGAKVFSHAIKNDLHAIKILVEDSEKRGGKRSEMQKIIELCDLNLERLDNLRKVLNINTVELVPYDIVKCVQMGIERVDIPKHISFIKEFEEKPMWAFLDKNYFSEVIVAILQNAIDAVKLKNTGKGEIRLSVYKRYHEIVISIKDNGCGLGQDKIKRIFDPFYSTKPSSMNWGMGLSYCNKIVRLHNGEIHFNSVLNEGSEALIYLPSAMAENEIEVIPEKACENS